MMGKANSTVTRRSVFQAAGALVFASYLHPQSMVASFAQDAKTRPPLLPSELDSFLSISTDGKVTGFFGKMDMGQGLETSISQIIADELDVAFDRVSLVMCDTATTLDMGGASNSAGIRHGSRVMRSVAAEARRLLLNMAAEKLGSPVESLSVQDGVVHVASDRSRAVSYGSLVGGQHFRSQLEWNKRYGFFLQVNGRAKPKTPDQYKIVGRSYPSVEVPGKVFGETEFVGDVRREGMLHARMIRPPVAGAVPVKVDGASISQISGAQVVQVKDLLAVVAPDEWNAIRASKALKVTWSRVNPPFPAMADLYDHIRKAPTVGENADDIFNGRVPVDEKPAEVAFGKAKNIIEREYEYPFQSHACMGPACAVVEIVDGKATLWTGSQKAHSARDGVAAILGIPVENVRAIWMHGPGTYGRNEAGDAALDAAVLAKATGKPVRVQYMRDEGHGWDPKGPACVIHMKAGLDENNNISAYRFKARAFSSLDMSPWEADPSDTLPGMLTGAPIKSKQNFGVPSNAYQFPVKLAFWQSIPPLLDRASPLRTGHLRDPQGPQCQFASESFMDEIAFETGVDPVAFRLRYLKNPRDIAVIQAVAKRANWEPRTKPRLQKRGAVMIGQGIAYATRQGTIAALIADVEVDPQTGRVWVRKFTIAHDCGQIINPKLLEKTIEGNLVMATSRSLFEEVQFSRENVTSLDWSNYPILEMPDVPEEIDIVLLDRPEVDPTGAGEPSTRHVTAAIANAIFDATGRRLRRAPFSPDRIRAVLG